MPLRLYNTFSKKEENFEPANPKAVTMYTCGPTVYGRPHIGNYSSFLMADLLRRWLEAGHGYTVVHAKNITDVGHLVADADIGEDKVERQAREESGSVTHESVLGIARKYERQYREDEKTLNMLEPRHRPRATEYIDQMKDMIGVLLQKGHAYATKDGIYFAVATFPAYGKLSGNVLDTLDAGARVQLNEAKRHPADFALWKFCVGINEHHALRWPSPKGPAGDSYPEGFPGWHIECSAMSRSLLGDTLDLHTGGEDNIFPHHECEIAQTECVTGHPFVRLWLHRRRIDLEGEKMSKSLGNVLTIPNILERENGKYDAMDLRYYLLSVHYRTNLKFSWKGLDDAHKARRKIMEWMGEVTIDGKSATGDAKEGMAQKTIDFFADAMNEDLNTPGALAEVFESMNYYRRYKPFGKKETTLWLEFIDKVRHTFGCFDAPTSAVAIPNEVQALVDQRGAARTAKNFAESDRLRNEIKKHGYEVRDAGKEQVVKKL